MSTPSFEDRRYLTENNPRCTIQDYMNFFSVSKNTAAKMLNTDKAALDKQFITYQDFWYMYDAFPSKTFVPSWNHIKYN